MSNKFQVLANIAAICVQHQVRHFIISPGSRSAPLTVSFIRQPELQCRVVMDERAAGYIALGLAQQTRTPVGLVCTSGTAALNYGPAVAEAFYQQIPLLVFTADRPPEWIDQQDNQAIHQQELYAPHCRGYFELPVDYTHPDAQWHAGRIISEALNRSRWPIPGPVHLNAPFREPLYPAPKTHFIAQPNPKIVRLAPSEPTLSPTVWEALLSDWQRADKKLIVAGMYPFDPSLAKTLATLRQDPTTAVVADITANLHQIEAPVRQADIILGLKSSAALESLQPDLLITFGGPVVSKNLKSFLRKYQPQAHWRLDPGGQIIDTFQSLTQVLPVSAPYFFQNLVRQTSPPANGLVVTPDDAYQHLWSTLEEKAQALLTNFLDQAPFDEFSAVCQVMKALPSGSCLQLGNSMPIRYANLIGLESESGAKHIRVNANRGVSGIDGALSTAVGAAMATDCLTILITGDLAFFYDRNALWHNHVPPNLRVVIMNNQGGGIFKLIDGPGNLTKAELAEYFLTPHSLTAKNIAADHNCAYFNCYNAEGLQQHIPEFFAPRQQAAILEIETDSDINAEVFRKFKSRLAELG